MATSSVVTGFVWPTEMEVPPRVVGQKCLGKIFFFKEANMTKLRIDGCCITKYMLYSFLLLLPSFSLCFNHEK